MMCALRKNLILAVRARLSLQVKAAGPRVDGPLAKLLESTCRFLLMQYIKRQNTMTDVPCRINSVRAVFS